LFLSYMYTPGVSSAAFRGSIVQQVATCLNSWFREANVCMHLAHLLCSSGLAVSKRAFPAKICPMSSESTHVVRAWKTSKVQPSKAMHKHTRTVTHAHKHARTHSTTSRFLHASHANPSKSQPGLFDLTHLQHQFRSFHHWRGFGPEHWLAPSSSAPRPSNPKPCILSPGCQTPVIPHPAPHSLSFIAATKTSLSPCANSCLTVPFSSLKAIPQPPPGLHVLHMS
jgi:hypothetical protein